MTTEPLISIVIPAYNCANYVEETFQSIVNQSYENWEVIIVNDGSTDHTSEVLKTLRAKQSVKIIDQVNGKQGKARNNGIAHAQGEWIAFLDADDLWDKNKLRLQLENTRNVGADLSFTDGYICLGNDMTQRQFRFGVEDKLYKGNEGIQLFHAQNRVPTSSVLVKRKVLQEIGGFPEDPDIQNCEDYFLWTSLLAQGYSLLGIQKPLLLYRVYPESSTGKEIKLLYPLLNCLIKIPGKHDRAVQVHLHTTVKKLLELIETNEAYEGAKPLLKKVISNLYIRFQKKIILLALYTNRKLLLSLLWRLKPNKK